MKISAFKKLILTGTTVSALALTPQLHANVELIISGGNASSSVLFERATNLFGGTFTGTFGLSSSTVRTYQGTIASQPTLGTVTLDFILNGAVGALQDIENQNPETTAAGTNTLPPTVVDSSTSPGAVGLNASVLTGLHVYVVPYVFIKNIGASSTDSASITNLTAFQASYLEGAAATIPATFFGGAGTNPVYFIGRNNQSAVRTEVDLNIGFTGTLQSYYTNGLSNTPILDTTSTDPDGSFDPGLTSGSTLYNTVLAVSNSIGTVAVQNAKSGAARLTYQGVPYSYSNVVNGTYPLWFHEDYYYKNTGAGQLTPGQSTVLQLFYGSITNAAYTVNAVYTNNFIPEAALNVKRTLDGGPITLH
jgi:hypothetical protein